MAKLNVRVVILVPYEPKFNSTGHLSCNSWTQSFLWHYFDNVGYKLMAITYWSHTAIHRAHTVESKISAESVQLCDSVGLPTHVIPVLYLTEKQVN